MLANHAVHTEIMPYKEALATGAMALFSEKYGDTGPRRDDGDEQGAMRRYPRRGDRPDRPLSDDAGGEHGRRHPPHRGADGDRGREFLRRRNDLVAALAGRLQTTPDALADRVRQLQEEFAEARQSTGRRAARPGPDEAVELAATPSEVHGVPLVAAVVSAPDDRALREMGDADSQPPRFGRHLLATENDGQAQFIVTVDDALAKRGLHAGKIAGAVGERLGGRGGGRPDSAQGGSNDTRNLRATIAEAGALIA